jgi:hypothetical protein
LALIGPSFQHEDENYIEQSEYLLKTIEAYGDHETVTVAPIELESGGKF